MRIYVEKTLQLITLPSQTLVNQVCLQQVRVFVCAESCQQECVKCVCVRVGVCV